MNWSPEVVAKLRRLAAEKPSLTSVQIGVRLGCSRGAVLGKCFRAHIHLGAARKPKGGAKGVAKKAALPSRHYSPEWGS